MYDLVREQVKHHSYSDTYDFSCCKEDAGPGQADASEADESQAAGSTRFGLRRWVTKVASAKHARCTLSDKPKGRRTRIRSCTTLSVSGRGAPGQG